MVSPSKNIASWFRVNREKYRTSTAHNTVDPAISVSQPGGITLIACKELKQYAQDRRGDFRKLGRWNSWIIVLSRSIGITIRYAEVHLIYGLSILLGNMVASNHPSWRHNMFLPFSLRDRQSSMRRLDRSHWSNTPLPLH